MQVGAIVRHIAWKDQNRTATRDLSGSTAGWGVDVSSNLNFTKKNVGKFQVTYGKGVENYMNDAPVDIGIQDNFSNPQKPIIGVPLPVFGLVTFLDNTWSPKFTSSMGFSMLNITNSDGQDDSAFHRGYYSLINFLYHPVPNAMMMAGLYDGSGGWAWRVGLPAKSGVGGGILAVVPCKGAIAVFAPPLDEAGNSVKAQDVITYVANKLNYNLFLPASVGWKQ